MSVDPAAERLRRFLNPRHALANCAIMQWQGVGEADTPGEDARCRMFLACGSDAPRITAAAFAAFGPPVVIACADWACEWLENERIGGIDRLSTQDFEQVLTLAPDERYAAVLVLDALACAVANIQTNLRS